MCVAATTRGEDGGDLLRDHPANLVHVVHRLLSHHRHQHRSSFELHVARRLRLQCLPSFLSYVLLLPHRGSVLHFFRNPLRDVAIRVTSHCPE